MVLKRKIVYTFILFLESRMEFGMVKMWFFVALSVVLMRKVVHSNVINQELEQLPPNFKPESYVLAISTYLPDKFIFDGKVTIKVSILTIKSITTSRRNHIFSVGNR